MRLHRVSVRQPFLEVVRVPLEHDLRPCFVLGEHERPGADPRGAGVVQRFLAGRLLSHDPALPVTGRDAPHEVERLLEVDTDGIIVHLLGAVEEDLTDVRLTGQARGEPLVVRVDDVVRRELASVQRGLVMPLDAFT